LAATLHLQKVNFLEGLRMRHIPHVLTGLLAACLAAGCERSAPTSAAPPSATPGADTAAGAETAGPAVAGGVATSGARDRAAAPAWREVTIPAGTTLTAVLDTAVGSDTSRVEDPVRAHLSKAVVVDGVTAAAEGSALSGVVTNVTRPGKVKGTAQLAVRFDALVPAGRDERYEIDTAAVGRSAPSQKKKDALEIGAPAAGGAIIGGIIGGKKGAAIGAAAGGGGGAAVVLTQRGSDVRLAKGAAVTVRLIEPLTVRVASLQ
jgi:hypothetical protein